MGRDTHALLLCSGIRNRIACPNYEVVRVVQLRFQPRTVDNLDLDYGSPHSLFNPNNKLCIPRTRDNINRLWTRYNINTTYRYEQRTYKWGTNSVVLGIMLPWLRHKLRILPGQNTRRIDHYLVARSATACRPNT